MGSGRAFLQNYQIIYGDLAFRGGNGSQQQHDVGKILANLNDNLNISTTWHLQADYKIVVVNSVN